MALGRRTVRLCRGSGLGWVTQTVRLCRGSGLGWVTQIRHPGSGGCVGCGSVPLSHCTGDSDDERVTEIDQSDNELESGDEQEELDGARVLIDDIIADRSDLSESDQSESPDENGQEEGEEMASNERPVEEEEEGSGFAAVDVDRVREDLEKGRAVKEQISECNVPLPSIVRCPRDRTLSVCVHRSSYCPLVYCSTVGRSTGGPHQAAQVSLSVQLSPSALAHACLPGCRG